MKCNKNPVLIKCYTWEQYKSKLLNSWQLWNQNGNFRKLELIGGLSDQQRQLLCRTDTVFASLGLRSSGLFRRLPDGISHGESLYLTASSHNLNQCWLIISTVPWHSPADDFRGKYSNQLNVFWNHTSESPAWSLWGEWVKVLGKSISMYMTYLSAKWGVRAKTALLHASFTPCYYSTTLILFCFTYRPAMAWPGPGRPPLGPGYPAQRMPLPTTGKISDVFSMEILQLLH